MPTPGFYFRVLEEGEIGAGDEVVNIASGRSEDTESLRVSDRVAYHTVDETWGEDREYRLLQRDCRPDR